MEVCYIRRINNRCILDKLNKFNLKGDLKKNLKEGEDEPAWIAVEIENFRSFRDKNGDGVMDREEIRNWILPADYDHTLNEAKHLIYEADENKVKIYN